MRDIVLGKLVDHTIDEDYQELSERLFGEGNCYNSSEVRKRMYGMRTIIDAIEREGRENIQDPQILVELEEKRIELKKERQRFFDQRREYNKIISDIGRKEHLEEKLIAAANELGDRIGLVHNENRSFVDLDDNEAVLVLCDWHYGLKTTNLWNTYDTDICLERVKRVVEMAAERLERHRSRRLHVVILGDMIHGAIHTSARVASDELVCEQLMEVSEILAQSIAELSQYVPEVLVYATYGNHARTVQNKNDSLHRDNMERIIPWWLAERLKDNDDITIVPESDSEIMVMDICGHSICASHGDLDNVGKSTRLYTMLSKLYGKNIECVLLADKHHRAELEELGISSMISGSLCGTDDYANGKRLYSTPEQLLFTVNERGIDATYHLACN